MPQRTPGPVQQSGRHSGADGSIVTGTTRRVAARRSGRRAGIFQVAHSNDAAIGLFLGGQPGAKLKEYICKLTVKQLAHEAGKPGSRYQWVKDHKRQQLLQAKGGEAPDVAERPA